MDMVTVCRFHTHRPNIFFSGSDDGLVAAFDFSNGVNEDDAFLVRPGCAYVHRHGAGISMHYLKRICHVTTSARRRASYT